MAHFEDFVASRVGKSSHCPCHIVVPQEEGVSDKMEAPIGSLPVLSSQTLIDLGSPANSADRTTAMNILATARGAPMHPRQG